MIHENFFDENSGTLAGLNCHEISFHLMMKPKGTPELHSDSYAHGTKEETHWITIEALKQYKAFPSWPSDYMSREHSGTEPYCNRR